MKRLMVVCALMASVVACKDKPPPSRTTQGTSLNAGATAMTPEIHIGPVDGGATNIQIGGARVVLPGENGRAAQAEGEAPQER